MTDTSIGDVVQELLVLWHALPTALPRDAGVPTEERVTTSENIHTIPLNSDVAGVLMDLGRAIPDWTRWAAAAAGVTAVTDIVGQLRQLPALHHGLVEQGRTRDADRLADTAQGWLSAARRALGLDLDDRHTGMHCPNHDDPLTMLIQPGDHGQLRYAKLDSHGRPIDPQVTWQRVEVVLCRHCDGMWTPSRYMQLGRDIKAANRRREDQADAA